MNKNVLVALLLVGNLSTVIGSSELSPSAETNKSVAKRIVEYYKGTGDAVDVTTVEQTLNAIDKNLPRYFPKQQFSRQDFIALAMLESEFNLYEVGSSGEIGVFQIMQSAIPRRIKNPFEINTNTRLCMKVLGWKWSEQMDYKRSIIAYNGIVRLRHRHGAWNETYWKRFQKRKTVLVSLGIK